MRNGRMRLAELPSQLILGQMGKQHGRSRCCGKCPLQKVNFCSGLFARQGKDELGMPPSGRFDAGIDVRWNSSAQGLWTVDMAEAPDVFDFFGR